MIRIVGGLLLALIVSTAQAEGYDRHSLHGWSQASIEQPRERHRARIHQHLRHVPKPTGYPERRVAKKSAAGHHEVQLLPHPSGCPSRAFCGCGASVEVFGHSVRELWLASNWFRFPRAVAAAGMVAVRRHHVFVIRAVLRPGLVLAYDANSGGHRTRLHPRSLAGYTVVDPRGNSRYARG